LAELCLTAGDQKSSERKAKSRFIVRIRGLVHGVGFRPFVYRVANEFGVRGWVANDGEGVVIEVEGSEDDVRKFLNAIGKKKPPLSQITNISVARAAFVGYQAFQIKPSTEAEEIRVMVLPDLATCAECMREVRDPKARRYRYPFTNCTNCGPRFSIIKALPYDRPRTTMAKFGMCSECRREYTNVLDRRFHAQPIACPRCGPRVWLADKRGEELAGGSRAIEEAARQLRLGKIIAMKGLGGFLLLCDATNPGAVVELRRRKRREEKPFAVMMLDLDSIERYCMIGELERELLTSYQSPIVLLRKREECDIADAVAPNNPFLGVMLPYTPLHHLIINEAKIPLVATSGNLSDEPIAKDNSEALERLGGIADLFLMHNRDIERRIDDSVLRVVGGDILMLRRARGYSPAHLRVPRLKGRRILALGGHLKNVVAISKDGEVILSQHVGDLDTKPAIQAFRVAVNSLKELYRFDPEAVAVDMHPRYFSTRYGFEAGLPVVEVQHHHAHVVSCAAERSLKFPVFGVAWDGVGYGADGEAWGSEFLVATPEGFECLAHLSSFPLPGGEASVRKPCRSATGLLWEIFGRDAPEIIRLTKTAKTMPEREVELNMEMAEKGINSPRVRGVGRFFDAVASILGVRQICSFEGQAAMELEYLAWKSFESRQGLKSYAFDITGTRTRIVTLGKVVDGIIHDLNSGEETSTISLRFHLTLAEIIRELFHELGEGLPLVLSGGVFQNTLLVSLVKKALATDGTEVHTHRLVPPNDGGISLGQAVIADARL
jgi:hydrogenase maturation protein HypF